MLMRRSKVLLRLVRWVLCTLLASIQTTWVVLGHSMARSMRRPPFLGSSVRGFMVSAAYSAASRSLSQVVVAVW